MNDHNENISDEGVRLFKEKLESFFEEENRRRTKLSALQSLLSSEHCLAVPLRETLIEKIRGKASFRSLGEVIVYAICSDDRLHDRYVELRGRDDTASMKLAHQEILTVLEGVLSHRKEALKARGESSGDEWRQTREALDRIHSLKSRKSDAKSGANKSANAGIKDGASSVSKKFKSHGVVAQPGGDSALVSDGVVRRADAAHEVVASEAVVQEFDGLFGEFEKD